MPLVRRHAATKSALGQGVPKPSILLSATTTLSPLAALQKSSPRPTLLPGSSSALPGTSSALPGSSPRPTLVPGSSSAAPAPPLHGVTAVLEFGAGARFVEKAQLRTAVQAAGARVVTTTLSASTVKGAGGPGAVLLVALRLHDPPSPSVRTALQLGVPVVGPAYIDACVAQHRRLDPDGFLVAGLTAAERFRTGHLAAGSGPAASNAPTAAAAAAVRPRLRSAKDVPPVPVLAPDNVAFEQGQAYTVLRHAYLVRRDRAALAAEVVCLELHSRSSGTATSFRVTCERRSADPAASAAVEVRLLGTAAEAEHVYAELFLQRSSGMQRVLVPPSPGIGSTALQALEAARAGPAVSPAVAELLTDIFDAADGELAAELGQALGSVTPAQLDLAESLLLTLGRVVYAPNAAAANAAWLAQTSNEFYEALPGQRHQPVLETAAVLQRKQTLCRLLRDLLTVREGAGCALFDATAVSTGATDLRYRALGCHLALLDPASPEHASVLTLVQSANAGAHRPIVVDAVYVARRPSEAHNTLIDEIPNQQLLVHSTRPEHLVGILSRYRPEG